MNEEQLQAFINSQIQAGIQQFINNAARNQESSTQRDGWIRAYEARAAGDTEIPNELHDQFQQEFTSRYYAQSSVKHFLAKYAEPKGGFLKTQHLDNQINVSQDTRKRDESIEELQRAVLCTNRPLLSLYDELTSRCEPSESVQRLREILADTIRYVGHVGASIELYRRQEIARAMGVNPFLECIARTNSSDPNQLVGPELRTILEAEKTRQAPKVQIPPQPKSKKGGGKSFRNKSQSNNRNSSSYSAPQNSATKQ